MDYKDKYASTPIDKNFDVMCMEDLHQRLNRDEQIEGQVIAKLHGTFLMGR